MAIRFGVRFHRDVRRFVLGDAQTNRMMDKVIATTIEQVMQLF